MIVNFFMEGCLQYVCQGEYERLNYIDHDGGEHKLSRYCVDKLGEGGQVRGFEAGGRHHLGQYSWIGGG